MAKQRQSSKAKPQAKPAAKKKPEKPTVEALSYEDGEKNFFSFFNKWNSSENAVEAAVAVRDKIQEQAKAAGIPTKELKLARALKKDDGVENSNREIERIARIRRYFAIPLGAQLDMFGGGKVKPAEQYYKDGRVAAMEDQARKAPSYLANKDADHWYEGFDAGRTAKNVERSAGFKPLGDVVNTLIPTSESAAPPPTNGGATPEATAPVH